MSHGSRQQDGLVHRDWSLLPRTPHTHSASEATGGSALIRDQAACPFRAFAKHRLVLPSLTPPQLGITASQRGAFLHEALFRIWHEIKSSDGLAGSQKQLKLTWSKRLSRRHAARGARVRNARV